jgi:DNA processing protein
MPETLDRLAWVTLSRTPQLGRRRLTAALQRFGGSDANRADAAVAFVRAGATAWTECALPPAARDYLASAKSSPTALERRWLDAACHHLLAFTDSGFPPLLTHLGDCPIALYVDGRPELLQAPQLAVVGSRNPTASGRTTAFNFAKYLSEHGLTVTSGMAEGVDTQAHLGALAARAATLAILGTGVDRSYPPGNRGLAREIARCGALVSEFPLQTAAARTHFPRRNRVMAALCLGTLVVEAAQRSGSLITARSAADLGREVFAIPGSIHNPLARGCHELIREGAALTDSADDILFQLKFPVLPRPAHCVPASVDSTSPEPAAMDKDHKILLDALGFDPTDLDALVIRTGFKPQAVSSMMLILELEGHVQAAHGGRYSRVARSL